MSRAIIHHGTKMPDASWSTTVEADVVLQPFHPLVREGRFTEAFPRAQRFVYTNPSALDRSRRPDLHDGLFHVSPSDRWQLPRLRYPAGLDIAVSDTVTLSRTPGIHGIFIDDLDRLIQDDPDLAHRFIGEVSTQTQSRFFINRGFDTFATVPRLDAVLFEDLDRDARAPGSRQWASDTLLPATRFARARGIRIHVLEYGQKKPRLSPAWRRNVSALCDSEARVFEESLNDWQDWT